MEQLQVSPALCDLDFGFPVCSELKLVRSAGDSMGKGHVLYRCLSTQECLSMRIRVRVMTFIDLWKGAFKMGREVWGGSGWGTRVHPWRMHVDVWKNQYNIVK